MATIASVSTFTTTTNLSIGSASTVAPPIPLKTANIAADKLIRLRSNLSLSGAPPPYCGNGRPRVHGNKFKLNDIATWSEPLEKLEVDQPKLGRVQICWWQNLQCTHSRTSNVIAQGGTPSANAAQKQ